MNALQHQMVSCEFCGGNHDSMDCQISASYDQVNFMGNFQGDQNTFQRPIQNQFQNKGQDSFQRPQANPQNNPYSNTYNPGWRNHPNLSYKKQNIVNQPPSGFAPQEKKTDLEDLLRNFISVSKTKLKNQEASIRNLENQVG